MRRTIVLVWLAVCGLWVPVSLGTGETRARTPTTHVTVTDVEVTPNQPAVGEAVTISATIRNRQASVAAYELLAVTIRSAPDVPLEEYARIEDLGSIPPGAAVTVPVVATFEHPGLYRLRLYAYGRVNGSSVRIRHPILVRVTGRHNTHPAVDIEPRRAVTGARTTVNVTLANGLRDAVRNAVVRLSGPGIAIADDTEVLARLSRGEATTVDFDIRPLGSGEQSITAALRYTTATGMVRTRNVSSRIIVEPAHPSITLDARSVGSGHTPSIVVEVRNDGNVAIEQLTLRARTATTSAERRLSDRLDPSESTTVRLNLSVNESGRHPTTVEASYEAVGRERQQQTTLTITSVPGTVTLTDIDVDRTNGRLQIAGRASNVGLTPVRNVVVAVQRGGDEPTRPNRRSFVGTVPPGDAVPFELAPVVDDDTSRVPIRVTYLVEGEGDRRETHATVAADTQPAHAGEIRLTGVDVRSEGETVHVSGSASNVGVTGVDGVVVSVVRTDGVTPAFPNKEFFVGTVPASDFVAFDVFARVDAGVTAIPLRVSYLVDGERRERTTTIEYDRGVSTVPDTETASVTPETIGGLVVGLVFVGAVSAIAWRNRRDDR